VKNELGGESDRGGESFISIVKNGPFFIREIERERMREKSQDIRFLRAGEIILGCSYTHFIICNKLICLLLVGGQHMGLLSPD
jgi:hypothetical protein